MSAKMETSAQDRKREAGGLRTMATTRMLNGQLKKASDMAAEMSRAVARNTGAKAFPAITRKVPTTGLKVHSGMYTISSS